MFFIQSQTPPHVIFIIILSQYESKLRERDDTMSKMKRESEISEQTIAQMRVQLDQAYTTLAGMYGV